MSEWIDIEPAEASAAAGTEDPQNRACHTAATRRKAETGLRTIAGLPAVYCSVVTVEIKEQSNG